MKFHGTSLSGWASLALAAALVLLSPGLSRAGGEPPRVLTLEDAWKISLAQNQDIQAAREFANKVKGIYVEARATALPHLKLQTDYYRSRDESQAALTGGFAPTLHTSPEASVILDQTLFTWGQVSAAIRGAKVGLLTADDELRLSRQAVMRDVALGFYDVLLAKEFLDIARENLALKERHRDAAEKRRKSGVATDYDVLAARVDVQNARPEVIRAENSVQTSRERLGFFLAMEGSGLEVAGSLAADLTETAVTKEEAYALSLRDRPEVSAILHRIDMAKELIKVIGAGDKPRVDLHAEYGWKGMEAGKNWAAGEESLAGVFLTFPFFDGLETRGKVAQAKSDHRTFMIQAEKLKESLRLEVFTALDAVRESAEIIRALSGTVSEAEKLLSMAEKGFEFGVKTRLDVEDAQLALMRAKGGLAQARRDFLAARTQFEWTVGSLDKKAPTP